MTRTDKILIALANIGTGLTALFWAMRLAGITSWSWWAVFAPMLAAIIPVGGTLLILLSRLWLRAGGWVR